METLLQQFIQRFRPRVGWPLALGALLAVLCPSFAADASPLKLPAHLFFWAGLGGLVIGMRGVRFGLWIAIVGAGVGAIFVLAADSALPPPGLVLQDVTALLDWAARALRRLDGAGAPFASRTWTFMAAALPRAWHDIVTAPNAGESGARLLVAISGVVLTWAGSLTLGRSLAARRALLGWSLPLLVALGLTTILGAAPGAILFFGLGLVLGLAIATGFQRRELDWDRTGTDFSDELSRDVLMWGSAAIGAVLVVAWLLPAWLENPIANTIWHDVETPSGLAVLERNIRSTSGSVTVDPSISKLPALPLGQSLEQAPPDTIALRIRLAAPLPDTPWPHYWRARIFNIYTGVGWTTDAHVSPQAPGAPADGAVPGTIVQEVEDTRPDRQIVIGLPDVLAIDIPTNAERLPDGTLVALTAPEPVARYQVLSRPPELAPQRSPDSPPPDMRGYLALPRNIPPRVHELTRAIAGDRASAYDQALSLESYLRSLPYAYQVRPLPRGGDAVDQFLFDMRQGYCTYYASAMAVMARDLGIPARVASGYATGAYDRAAGAFTIREVEAHAWPELYIDDRWVPFEPTPIRPLPARDVGAAPPAPAPATTQQARWTGPLIWLAVLAVLALLGGAGLWLGRGLAPVPLVARVQMQLERRGRQAGVAWPAGATLHEYGALLAPRLGSASGALDEIVDLIERARYSGRELHEEEQRRLRAAGEQVWAQLRRGTRR